MTLVCQLQKSCISLADKEEIITDLQARGFREFGDGVTKIIIEITGKDHAHAHVVRALMHGLVDLEIAGRFPKDADLYLT